LSFDKKEGKGAKHPGIVWLLMTLINFVLKDIKHFQMHYEDMIQ